MIGLSLDLLMTCSGCLPDTAAACLAKGHRNTKEGTAGSLGARSFFQDARAGDYRALARMEKEGYGAAWNRPFFQGRVEREIVRNLARGKPGFPAGS